MVLTRQTECNNRLKEQIEKLQGQAVCLPLLATEDLVTPLLQEELAYKLNTINLCICISRNAAQYIDFKLTKPPSCLWAAVGPHTAQYLQAQGLSSVLYPTEPPFDSRSLLNTLKLHNINLAKQYIMILTGEGGDPWLRNELIEHGAAVETLPLYKRVLPADAPGRFNELFNHEPELDIILITCITSLVNLMRLAQASQILIYHLPLLVVSQRIYAYALAHGFTEVYVAKSIADEDILLALESYRCVNAKII